MNTRTIVVLAVCALLFVSSIDCKKVAKNEKKAKKTKTEKPAKAAKVVVEEVVVPEVIEAPVVPEEPENLVVEAEVAQEEPAAPAAPVHRYKASPPKSLKVTSAYEQCKLECRKERDAVQAKDYVEQLRVELRAAEAAIAAEIEASGASGAEPVASGEEPASVIPADCSL